MKASKWGSRDHYQMKASMRGSRDTAANLGHAVEQSRHQLEPPGSQEGRLQQRHPGGLTPLGGDPRLGIRASGVKIGAVAHALDGVGMAVKKQPIQEGRKQWQRSGPLLLSPLAQLIPASRNGK